MKLNRLFKIIITVIGIGLIISLSRNIYRLLKVSDQVKLAEERLEKLRRENQELQEKRKFYQSEEFIEREARNKLNMSKPGETVVILPPNMEDGEKISVSTPELKNWQKWLKLFF